MVKAEKHSLSLTGDLWAFRPRLNLEHISQSLKADEKSQKYALLAYFLKEVRRLYIIKTINIH